jgi:hypothetical protein
MQIVSASGPHWKSGAFNWLQKNLSCPKDAPIMDLSDCPPTGSVAYDFGFI